jgi:hypothetical protein
MGDNLLLSGGKRDQAALVLKRCGTILAHHGRGGKARRRPLEGATSDGRPLLALRCGCAERPAAPGPPTGCPLT